GEPDPAETVKRQAAQVLGAQAAAYQDLRQDSSQPVPRRGDISFVLDLPGVEVNPPRRSFRWEEDVHREEFRLRAPEERDGQTVRGRLTVFLGTLLLAEVPLSLRVASAQRADAEGGQPASDSARPYRQIFASYSHKDAEIVEQFRHYARALGDEYLIDCTHLRSGEEWSRRLEELID